MNKINLVVLLIVQLFLTGCAVKTPVVNQYKLDGFSNKHLGNRHASVSLLISEPEAVAGYQTEQMYYVKKPFGLSSFVHNAWVSSPAKMLLPLLIQSLQNTGYFYAVVTTPYANKADYRLDTQLVELQQNFLCKPSVIQFVVKVVLTHTEDDRVIASRIINLRVNCPQDTPYGGVIAANQATTTFTALVSDFVVTHINRDNQHHVMLSQAIAKNSKRLYNDPPSRPDKNIYTKNNKGDKG